MQWNHSEFFFIILNIFIAKWKGRTWKLLGHYIYPKRDQNDKNLNQWLDCKQPEFCKDSSFDNYQKLEHEFMESIELIHWWLSFYLWTKETRGMKLQNISFIFVNQNYS